MINVQDGENWWRLSLFQCLNVSVFDCLSLALLFSGKTHRLQYIRGAVKKKAALLRKACASQ